MRMPHSMTCHQGSQEGGKGKRENLPSKWKNKWEHTKYIWLCPYRSTTEFNILFLQPARYRGMQLYPNRQGMLQMWWYVTVEHNTALHSPHSRYLRDINTRSAWLGDILSAELKWYSIQVEIAWSVFRTAYSTPHSLVQSTNSTFVKNSRLEFDTILQTDPTTWKCDSIRWITPSTPGRESGGCYPIHASLACRI